MEESAREAKEQEAALSGQGIRNVKLQDAQNKSKREALC